MGEASDSSSRADSFGTFLKSLQEAEGESAGRDRAVIELLRELTRSGPQPLHEVQEATGLGFLAFADAVKACVRADLVSISGPEGQETIELTQIGSRLASVVT
jgi:hypothetical protein